MNLSIPLKNLEDKFRDILLQISKLDTDSSEITNAISIYKKIRLTRLLNDNRFIAIAGAQGAGKTTLISQIYPLNDWLEGNIGRGETIPIFIKEDVTLKSPQAYQTRINENGKEECLPCDSDKFKQLIKGNDKNLLLLELKVPSKFDMDSKTAWVLLPGYELINSNNAPWQSLMRHIVQHAASKIIVIDEQRLAKDQSALQEDLNSTIIGESRPLIAITRTEGIRNDAEKIQELIQRAQEVFNVDEHSIVCTGNDPLNWLTEFEEKTVTSLNTQSSTIQSQLNGLRELFADELDDVIARIEAKIDNFDLQESTASRQIEKLLKSFDKSVEKYRKEYQNELKNSFTTIANQATQKAKEKYTAEEEGFSNNLGIALKKISFRGSQVSDNRLKRIENEWNQIDKTSICTNVIQEIAKKNLKLPSIKTSNNNLLGYENNQTTDQDQIKNFESYQQGMQILLKAHEISDNRNTLEKTIEILPTLAMEHYRLIQSGLSINNPDISIDNLYPDYYALFEQVASQLQHSGGYIKPLLTTMGLVAGADIAADGKLDGQFTTSPNDDDSSEADSSSSTVSPATLAMGIPKAPIVGILLGAAVLYATYKVSEHVFHVDTAQKNAIDYYIRAFSQNHQSYLLSQFDDSMQRIRDLIEDNLKHIYGVETQINEHHLLLQNLKHLKKTRKHVNSFITETLMQQN